MDIYIVNIFLSIFTDNPIEPADLSELSTLLKSEIFVDDENFPQISISPAPYIDGQDFPMLIMENRDSEITIVGGHKKTEIIFKFEKNNKLNNFNFDDTKLKLDKFISKSIQFNTLHSRNVNRIGFTVDSFSPDENYKGPIHLITDESILGEVTELSIRWNQIVNINNIDSNLLSRIEQRILVSNGKKGKFLQKDINTPNGVNNSFNAEQISNYVDTAWRMIKDKNLNIYHSI